MCCRPTSLNLGNPLLTLWPDQCAIALELFGRYTHLMARTSKRQTDPATQSPKAQTAAADFNLAEKPGFLFRRLDTRATLLYQKHTGQAEITPRQFGVLLMLYQNGRMTQAELAKAVFIDKSTLGEMLQRMVDRGLVHRRIPEEDRRTAELWLSDAGRQMALSFVPQAEAAQQELVAPLPVEYRALFLKCLKMLADAEGEAV
jgi:DNA-binding MarR family transcriptional regulator